MEAGPIHKCWECARPHPQFKGILDRQEADARADCHHPQRHHPGKFNKSPPEGGVLARRTNGDFLISLHRHVSETALVQMMRSLRALDPGFEMSLEMAGNITLH